MLTTVEKVIFLQEIDIFENTLTEDLAHIAIIAEEMELPKDLTVFKEGDISDAMYMVISGKVGLTREKKEVLVATTRDAFGSWALFDDEPQVVTATLLEDSALLKIDKEDFVDLLSDHVQISQSIMKTMVTRLRNLGTRAGIR